MLMSDLLGASRGAAQCNLHGGSWIALMPGRSCWPLCYTADDMSVLLGLICSRCQERFDAWQLQGVCSKCESTLLAEYDTARLAQELSRETLAERPAGMWRWAELLPVRDPAFRFSLGEGDTPLLALPQLAKELGLDSLLLKDESVNPTGTFKARGLATAISRAAELGARDFVIPTAGNAGAALAAYAARAGLGAHVFMPHDAPDVNRIEIAAMGADMHLVPGLIDQAGKQAALQAQQNGWFDVSTFKEPYRVEGKKTMGFELAEVLEWELPEVIVYPTGGGTGLVGMWKAFRELNALGWINGRSPRFVSVQASGCAPVVHAMNSGADHITAWKDASTQAHGLRVPISKLLWVTWLGGRAFWPALKEQPHWQVCESWCGVDGWRNLNVWCFLIPAAD
jgi:threonine synthase